MKTLRTALTATLLLAACTFDVPDLNRPGIESLQNPTPSQVEALATGLLIGARASYIDDTGVVSEWGVLGRESLVLTPSDPRFVSELLQGPNLDPGSGNFGGNNWRLPYANIRGANLLLNALDNPTLVGLTTAQKESLRGFAETIQALDYLQVLDAHDSNGVVLDVNHDLGSTPAPIVTSTDDAFTFLEKLLDDAQAHLAAGGSAFPIPLGTGFTGFDTPATFAKFNRALRARVAVYHGKFADALTALAASFLDTGAPLTLGVYHAYGSGTGDTPNDLNASEILCHPSVVLEAEALPGGGSKCSGAPPLPLDCLDERVGAKVKALAKPTALSNHSSGYVFTLYPASTSPIAIIRNEELILLRAEANIGLGNVGVAKADINFIRTNSGGLPAKGTLDATNILDELLNQKRYSLLFEGGHRWIDLRRYGKLDFAHVAQDTPQDTLHARYPLPLIETQPRGF